MLINLQILLWVFDDEDNTYQFGWSLRQLTTLLCLFARAIQCLEAKDTTPDDVYLYLLAIVAYIHDLIVKGKSKVENGVMEDICWIINYWFSKLIESDQAQNIYLVTFALHPAKPEGI